MRDSLEFYGWPVSPYTEKTRAWLRFKGIPAREIAPSWPRLRLRIMPAVGRFVMPTVRMPGGTWLQDSRVIIDTLEGAHPEPSTEPSGLRQRVASSLLEVYGDEWLVLAALHYRWNIPENAVFAVDEFARLGLPWVPRRLARPVAKVLARRMQAYRPKLGITERTQPGIEQMTERFIAALQAHLATHRFLLGDRPCVGDFALLGPLWAHLERDPYSRHVFDGAPDVLAWTARLREPPPTVGDYLPDDAVPATLEAVLSLVVSDQWPHLHQVMHAVDRWCVAHPDADRVPRALGDVEFEVGGTTGRRRLVTFQAWKAQRVLARVDEARQGNDARDREAWLRRIGGDWLCAPPPIHPQHFVPFQLNLTRSEPV